MTGGEWAKYHELKILRNGRRVIEERLQQVFQGRGPGRLKAKNRFPNTEVAFNHKRNGRSNGPNTPSGE